MTHIRCTVSAVTLGAVLVLSTGCVTVAEQRKLEHEVAILKGARGPAGHETQRMADLALEVDELRQAIARLDGRIDLAEHQAARALAEAQAARQQAANRPPPPLQLDSGDVGQPRSSTPGPEAGQLAGAHDEVAAYREAHAAWRAGDTQTCIDRFQQFLQTHPSSAYADDAAFWMADCYFKQGDYRAAILRFDDVASGYPTGNKAADALYRQGEALMRLGPGYSKAARRAFERVIEEYPDSARVSQARRQLDALGTG